MASVFWGASFMLPTDICIVVALVTRVLLTGALHEDGCADFCDGFGGGHDRKRTLEIMKDSHIGTYGVLGLVLYFMLMYSVIDGIPTEVIPLLFLCGDPLCKWISSNIVCILPYARKESEAKNKLVYTAISKKESIASFVIGTLPIVLAIATMAIPVYWLYAAITPIIVFALTTQMMRKRLNGYTGDCCGALFIMCELAFCVSIAVLCHINI
jgi:adenosylcobinamide-GDP ribazoletransferase